MNLLNTQNHSDEIMRIQRQIAQEAADKKEYEDALALKKTMHARIYDRKFVNALKTLEEGKVTYNNVTYIWRKSAHTELAKDEYDSELTPKLADEYKYLYNLYLKKQDVIKSGTPIEDWVAHDNIFVSDMEQEGIYTVEQLASVNYNSLPIKNYHAPTEVNPSNMVKEPDRDLWALVQAAQQFVENKGLPAKE